MLIDLAMLAGFNCRITWGPQFVILTRSRSGLAKAEVQRTDGKGHPRGWPKGPGSSHPPKHQTARTKADRTSHSATSARSFHNGFGGRPLDPRHLQPCPCMPLFRMSELDLHSGLCDKYPIAKNIKPTRNCIGRSRCVYTHIHIHMYTYIYTYMYA